MGNDQTATSYKCWRLRFDPLEYLRDVLARVVAHPRSKIWVLTPRGWMEARGRD
ncbi:MAG: transposase domain-containing protein [Planctomycetes bacterium]|nr:transposase domain-containing protein [Planctomycetota bacterium]